VIDYVGGHGLNVTAMNIEVTAVNFTGDTAKANVSFTPKGTPGAPGMSRSICSSSKAPMGCDRTQASRRHAARRRRHAGRSDAGGAMNPHGAMPPAP